MVVVVLSDACGRWCCLSRLSGFAVRQRVLVVLGAQQFTNYIIDGCIQGRAFWGDEIIARVCTPLTLVLVSLAIWAGPLRLLAPRRRTRWLPDKTCKAKHLARCFRTCLEPLHHHYLGIMATQQTSTEPLRPATPPESHAMTMTEPERPATAHTTGQADALQVPGIQVDGASDDDERQPRSTTPVTAAAPSTNPSRAASPNPHAIYPHTQVTYDDPDFRKPPPLNYSLRTRKNAIIWFWTLIFVDCILMPIGMYFGMWYGLTRDQLSANAVFSISTALLGTVSIVEYFVRFIRLWRKNSNCRVIGAQRHYLDWFHWNLSVGWFFVMIELIA